jgi:hypothetical protein
MAGGRWGRMVIRRPPVHRTIAYSATHAVRFSAAVRYQTDAR